ncbi:glycosyltransferase 87 family protein [Nocardia sp. GCM10030253]|uniref:glycosyltransferase 87 family protein n=1 Tax=Nocardia sp. GCM10030253 TaxID=3273404 RepID=UPI00364352AF
MLNSRPLEFPPKGPALFILIGSALLAVILVFTTVDPWLDRAGILAGGLDVHVYRDGAYRILHGLPLYTEPTVAGLLYTYTPFSTIAFIPIDMVPWTYVTNTWLVVNLGVLFANVLMAWRILGYRLSARLVSISALLALTCVFIEPVRTTLYYGQINLVLMLLVLWDFSRPDHARLRGLGVGLAGGIKLVPIYFVAQFITLRQWRSAVTASAVFAASIGLTWIVLPTDSQQYWTSTFFQSNRIAVDINPANQSIRGAIAHLTGQAAPVWLWLLIAGIVAGISLAVTAGLHEHGERLLAVTLSGLTACAISPFSWGHHWVWFVPLLVYLVHKAQSTPRWWIAAAALFLSIGAWAYHWSADFVTIGVFMLPPSWPVAQILMNGYVIAYFAVLGGAIVLLARLPRNLPAPRTPQLLGNLMGRIRKSPQVS